MPGEIRSALAAEWLKARRSVVPWAAWAAIGLAAAVGGFFMFVLQDPDRARRFGLLGDKAQLSGGSADWPGYFGLVAQIASVGGLVVFGTVTIWLFGREFADRTAKDLLALPTSRTAVVVAKLLAALTWSALLCLTLIGLSLMAGAALGLPGGSPEALARGAGQVLACGLLTAALTATYALVASMTRGYLAAFGAMFLSLLCAQVVSAVGYGAWFPWAVPALLAGSAGPDQPAPGAAAVLLVLLVAGVAAVATARWWERADQTR